MPWIGSPLPPRSRLHSSILNLLIIILVLILLQYILSIILIVRQREFLFKMSTTHFLCNSKQGCPKGIVFSNQIHPNDTDINRNRSLFLSIINNASHKLMLNAHKLDRRSQITALQTLNSSTAGTVCPVVSPDLRGPIKVLMESPTLEELENKFPMLRLGGQYSPPECQARERVAIIIPYREREKHLRTLLLNLHPFLQRQQLNYAIYVVEQTETDPFNRAMLLNVGFVEALKKYNYDCFIFHDVDLLPENDRNLYTCPEQPRHMSVSVDVFNYKLPYPTIFGGVIAMTRDQFQKVNGFSNKFWGWGGEDDDMSNRVKSQGYYISRYPANVGRYKMLTHPMQYSNSKHQMYVEKGYKRFRTNGLINLHYNLKEVKLYKLFTRILVELTMPV